MNKHTIKNGCIGGFGRRNFIKGSGIAALSGVFGGLFARPAEAKRPLATYEYIGVRPIINGRGTVTVLGGSLMLPEVMNAMEEANRHYVVMDELHEYAGRYLAKLTGAEWGAVFSGAAGCITHAAAGCMTGLDQKKANSLPDSTGMKNEVIYHVSHRSGYDRNAQMTGAKLMYVRSADEMDKMVGEKTAAIFIMGEKLDNGQITLEEIVAIAKKHEVPTFVDAAAERPDIPNRYLAAGVDLVAYSGGKCLRGPQSAGLLLGKKDLIEAAYLNGSPRSSVGRPMKVGKEEIIGALVAMDMWINHRDHQAELKEFYRRMNHIKDVITKIPGVSATVALPKRRINVAPEITISWDPNTVKITPNDAIAQLGEGNPRIMVNGSKGGFAILSYMLEKGDEKVIAKRIHETLSKAQTA